MFRLMPAAGESLDSAGIAELLGEPVRLRCGTELSNRFAKAPMSEQLASVSNAPTERLIRLYERFAESGAGLLMTGNVMIDRRHLGEPYNVVLEDHKHFEQMRTWAGTAKSGGAQVWLQVNHPGRQVPRMLRRSPLAPSPIGV